MITKVKDSEQLDLFSISSSSVGVGGELDTASPIAINVTKFCQTCFRTFSSSEMGEDSRYCKECEATLNDEWQSMATRGVMIKPGWVPRNGNEPRRINKKHNGNGIKKLPVRKINKMAAKGMKPSRVAAELIKQGYSVNYRTIAKMVKRKMVR